MLYRYVPQLQAKLPTNIAALRKLAGHVAADKKIKGVVLHVPGLRAGWATIQSVRDVLAEIRASGKEVVAYIPEAGGNKEIYLAMAADRVYLAPQATLMTLGLALSSKYYKTLLDKIGIGVERFARAEYKTAAESMTREGMSEPQREQLTGLMNAFDGALTDAIASRPGMTQEKAREIFDKGMIRGTHAVELGLADGTCYEDELPTVLNQKTTGKLARIVAASGYYGFMEASFFAQFAPRPYIAVVEVEGAINGAKGTHPAVPALRLARKDPRALGVLLRVTSPGGSAMTSDLIHREVMRVKEKKPVVAAFGDVAASGGYYVAAGTDAIVAQPTTITGSIGVVSARFMAKRFMDQLGVNTETIRSAPHADMFSPTRALEADERAILDRELDGFYDAFVSLVADGRGRDKDEVEPLARGRVWSGTDAKKHGLVDALGGLDVAVAELKKRIKGPAAVVERLEPAVVWVKQGNVPPAPPQKAAQVAQLATAAVTRSLLNDFAPEVADLIELAKGPDKVLMYACGVPEIE